MVHGYPAKNCTHQLRLNQVIPRTCPHGLAGAQQECPPYRPKEYDTYSNSAFLLSHMLGRLFFQQRPLACLTAELGVRYIHAAHQRGASLRTAMARERPSAGRRRAMVRSWQGLWRPLGRLRVSQGMASRDCNSTHMICRYV